MKVAFRDWLQKHVYNLLCGCIVSVWAAVWISASILMVYGTPRLDGKAAKNGLNHMEDGMRWNGWARHSVDSSDSWRATLLTIFPTRTEQPVKCKRMRGNGFYVDSRLAWRCLIRTGQGAGPERLLRHGPYSLGQSKRKNDALLMWR